MFNLKLVMPRVKFQALKDMPVTQKMRQMMPKEKLMILIVIIVKAMLVRPKTIFIPPSEPCLML